MGLIYIGSFLLLYISLLFFDYKKKGKKIIISLFINLFLMIIINSLIVFVFSQFNLEANLLLRSFIFILLSIPLYYFIFKKNKLAKFNISIYEIGFLIASLIITLTISFYRFGPDFNIYFETTDPAAHYLMADRFSNSNKLLEYSPVDKLYGENNNATLFLSYTCLGTIYQLQDFFHVSPFINKTYAFIIFELIVVFLSCIVIFYIADNFINKWNFKKFILIVLLVILFAYGYVLNNLIFGFHYLGLSILLIEFIIYLMEDAIKTQKFTWFNLVILNLFCFSIFSTYYLFVPIVYGSIGIYLLYCYKIRKIMTFKEACKYIFIILVIPFIIGMWYYFFMDFGSLTHTSASNIFTLEGYIYRNLYTNFIFLAIICIYSFFVSIKNKDNTLVEFALIFNSCFILLLFFFFYKNLIASYYYYKLYYSLWTLSFIDFAIIIVKNLKELKGFSTCILVTLCLLFIAEQCDIDNRLYRKNTLLNPVTAVDSIENIYWFNKVRSDKNITDSIYNKSEVIDLQKINDKYNKTLKNNNFVFYEGLLEKLWFYSYTKTIPNGNNKELMAFYDENLSIDEVEKDENIKYIIYRSDEKKQYTSTYFQNIYETKNYILAEKIK